MLVLVRWCALWLAVMLSASCTKHGAVDVVMGSAFRPDPPPAARQGRYVLLAGDMHCHVSPPDSPGHVGRNLEDTFELAHEENLDFIVLTPHLGERFFADPAERDFALGSQQRLRARVMNRPSQDLIVIVGFEYSDHEYGHLGASFANLEAVLDEVPLAAARQEPERFFERYVAQGGILVINHPYLTPLDVGIANARWDLSWRGWTSFTRLPREIIEAGRRAQAIEVYNESVDHLRDAFLLSSPGTSMRSALFQMERQIRLQQRRISPVGGSDSHSHHLRATTFVLSETRTEIGIREAIQAGRVCVRSPAACTFEVRSQGGDWQPIGSLIYARSLVEVRARGASIEVFRDGRTVAKPENNQIVKIGIAPQTCTLLRAYVDGGFSGPVYVNCGFASAS